MDKLTTYKQKKQNYTAVRYSLTVNEVTKDYILVPVVMMVPGVHEGSQGPMLHTAENLQANVEQWNERPVVIYHPQDAEGNYVSAYTEGVQTVGFIKNARYDNGLKAEIQLDVAALQTISPETLVLVENSQPVEVSIGAFSQTVTEVGVYEATGEQYAAITTAYMADHLAILPKAKGACSHNDGCGIRVYEQNNNHTKKGGQFMELKDALKELRAAGLEVLHLQVNEEGLLARLELIRNYVYGMDSEWVSCYVREVYDSSFIYEKSFKRNGAPKPNKLYKQDYLIAEDGSLLIESDPIEVVAKTEYMPIQANENKNENKKKGEQEMNKPCCPQKVEELIVNVAAKFTADDREWLQSLTEEQLEKVTPKVVQVNVGKEHVTSHLATYKSAEEVLELLPEALRNDISAGLEMNKAKRAELVTKIQANASSKDVWAKEELEAMETGMLEKLAKTIQTPAVYVAGQNPAPTGADEVPAMPPME
jgi:ribosomal protein L22